MSAPEYTLTIDEKSLQLLKLALDSFVARLNTADPAGRQHKADAEFVLEEINSVIGEKE